MVMARSCRICCTICTVIIGLTLIILGAVSIPIISQMINKKIINNVVLKNGTDTFQAWLNPPVPVYMQFWVFDLMNKDSVIKNGSKPVLKERGPYTYREVRPKHSIVFNPNGTLTYRQNKSFIFVREMSVGDHRNDTITTVNLLYATLVEKFRDYGWFAKWAINGALTTTDQHLFANLTVHDLIWGYRIDALKKLADIIHSVDKSFKIPYDIGLFADTNGTDDGNYTIFTGSEKVARLNMIDNRNGFRYLPYWTTPHCNLINGTDGTAYHPFIDKAETLYTFSSDICRSIYMKYEKEVELQGVSLYQFTPPADVFANHTTNPDNAGFCAPNCLDAGVLNVSICKQGAPVIMSQPHLYQAAPQYQHAIIGLHPDPKQHTTHLDIEPHTGLVLNAAKRLQINIYFRNIPRFADTENLPELTILPLAWVNESASLNAASADKFKSQVLTPILITHIIEYGLIALGGFLLLVILIVNLRPLLTRRRTNPECKDP